MRFLTLYVLLAVSSIIIFSGCSTSSPPKKTTRKKAFLDWRKMNEEILKKYRRQKRGKSDREFDELLKWVIDETHQQIDESKNTIDKKEILQKYELEKGSVDDKEYKELIDWVVDEIHRQIESGDYILLKKQKKQNPIPIKIYK